MTYTFETVFEVNYGAKVRARVEVTAPTEDIAWEQLGKKIRDNPFMIAQYKAKNFRLLGTDRATLVGRNQ